jgi:hypothetical protein
MWKVRRRRVARPVEKPADARGGSRASPLRVVRTVLWSFFGVRRSADNQEDFAGITPVQVIVAGVIGAVIFVTTLVMLVRFIAA